LLQQKVADTPGADVVCGGKIAAGYPRQGRCQLRVTGASIRALVGVVIAGLVLTLLPGVAEARPRNPSDREIRAAQVERARKAGEVGRLTGLVAKAEGDMRRATDQAELAIERYNKAVVDLGVATQRARTARTAAVAAERSVTAARNGFSSYARGSYIQGTNLVGAATLLDASSPIDLMQRAAMLSYAGSRRVAAVGELDRAKVRRANAESLTRRALADQRRATRQAEQAKIEAARLVAEARTLLAAARLQRSRLEVQLARARVALNGLYGERHRYQAWQRAQAIAAARERERLRQAREQAARRLARQSAVVYFGSGGSWSATKGQWVADAATRWLGTPYAWGGGNASGPTYGVNGPGAGFADGSVVGFDCSGLALWAWAQAGVYLPHYTGYQYTSGRHVPVGSLRPGDLVFWGYDTGDPATIHHVAIYIGGGRIIQAPQSGDVVRISSMWFDGYIGATRPGT
jgi:cell wall-associated NlpC family hydrolase